MNKPCRLLLFLAAFTVLATHVNGLRATSLIFGRGPNGTLVPTTSSTSSTTPPITTRGPAIVDSIANGTDSVIDDEQVNETDEVTKPPLTGIPQIDYVWDPNLPRELNGYNLSTYPFLSLVPDPEDIDFKCDGLHDGFYASLKYSCQLYHHCIYGIRHDFLCANFTAFDQKTFICQFVSEVNCKASPKYFFRNDALYIATTTTSTTTTTIAPPVTQPQPQYNNDRPLRARRPQRPRRPADYYYEDDEYEQDDYVEEQRFNRRRKQPAQRGRTRRPEYDDDYGQVQGRRFAANDDDRFAERRPNRNRNYGAEYDDDEEVAPPPRPLRNRNNDRRRPQQQPLADERDRYDSGPAPRPQQPRRKQAAARPKQPPSRYDDIDDEQPSAPGADADYDDRQPASVNRYVDDDGPKVNPSGGGSALFSRPRAPPRINRPVPLNDKRKYEYVTSKPAKTTTTTAAPASDDGYESEYEDDYDEPAAVVPIASSNDRSSSAATSVYARRPPPAKKTAAKITPPPLYEDDEDADDDVVAAPPPRNQYKQQPSQAPRRPQNQRKATPVAESRQKPRRPVANAFAEDDDEESLAPRSRPNRRPGAYTDDLDDVDERAPVQTQRNQRPRIVQSRPLANAYARKSAATVEILAEDDADDEADATVAPPAVRKSSRPTMSNRAKVQPEEVHSTRQRRPEAEAAPAGPPKARTQFRIRERDQYGRSTSTTTTTTTTTTSTPAPLDDSEYASDEYEDEELADVPASSPEPPTRPNKNIHRFAAVAQQTSSSESRSTQKAPGKFATPEEFYDTSSGESVQPTSAEQIRPAVRVVKRPFLPSRGGNPYLPRGLKPLGPIERDPPVYADDDEDGRHHDLGPAISGAKLLEFHPPLVSREPFAPTAGPSMAPSSSTTSSTSTSTTTPAPYHVDPNRKLEEIFNSELDVTLNDALNPTLKPLSSRNSPIGFSYKYNPSYYEPVANRRESLTSVADDLAQQTQVRSSSVHLPFYDTTAGGAATGGGRSAPIAAASIEGEFYGDYEY